MKGPYWYTSGRAMQEMNFIHSGEIQGSTEEDEAREGWIDQSFTSI